MVQYIEVTGRPHVKKLLEVTHADPVDIQPSDEFKKFVSTLKGWGLTRATLDVFETQVRQRYAVED